MSIKLQREHKVELAVLNERRNTGNQGTAKYFPQELESAVSPVWPARDPGFLLPKRTPTGMDRAAFFGSCNHKIYIFLQFQEATRSKFFGLGTQWWICREREQCNVYILTRLAPQRCSPLPFVESWALQSMLKSPENVKFFVISKIWVSRAQRKKQRLRLM